MTTTSQSQCRLVKSKGFKGMRRMVSPNGHDIPYSTLNSYVHRHSAKLTVWTGEDKSIFCRYSGNRLQLPNGEVIKCTAIDVIPTKPGYHPKIECLIQLTSDFI